MNCPLHSTERRFDYEIKSGPVTKVGGFVPSLSDCAQPTFVLEQKDWNGPGEFNEEFFTFSVSHIEMSESKWF